MKKTKCCSFFAEFFSFKMSNLGHFVLHSVLLRLHCTFQLNNVNYDFRFYALPNFLLVKTIEIDDIFSSSIVLGNLFFVFLFGFSF